MAIASTTPSPLYVRSLPKRASVLLMTGTSTIALAIGAPLWIGLHIRDGTFYWGPIVLFLGLWIVNGLGITIGYHRLCTHKSFKTSPVIEGLLYICGSIAAQGEIWKWVADHLIHHMYSDQKKKDPHTPKDGFFWAHWGWTIPYVSPLRAVHGDMIKKNPVARWVSKFNVIWVFGPLVLCYLIGGWDYLLWGGFIRLGFTYHITWAVNSVCHTWGSRPNNTNDNSRNNLIVALLGFGEGWHNNHHAKPSSARHGWKWWQIDTSWYVIWFLWQLNLVWDVILPTKEEIAAA